MSKNIAIIGASYLQLPLIEKAKQMGYTTHVFAWQANDVGEKAADYFYPISITEKEAIAEKCEEIGICGVCSIASDLAAVTVNYVADRMGLPGNTMEATLKSTNKYLMRKAFQANGDPSPKFFLVNGRTRLRELELAYPVIVKPTDRSGSRGVSRIETPGELEEAVKAAARAGFNGEVLIEEYVTGQEYSVECISFRGQHHFLAMTQKYTTGAPHFIETGHREPAPVARETLERVKRIVFHALDTLGIENSASHSEVKVDADGTIKIIEIGGRMGGDCIGSDLVPCSTGYDFVRMTIQVACGEEPDFTKAGEPRAAESIFLFTQEDVDQMNRLLRETPERVLKVVDYHPENIGKTTDSSNRAGCYIRLAAPQAEPFEQSSATGKGI